MQKKLFQGHFTFLVKTRMLQKSLISFQSGARSCPHVGEPVSSSQGCGKLQFLGQLACLSAQTFIPQQFLAVGELLWIATSIFLSCESSDTSFPGFSWCKFSDKKGKLCLKFPGFWSHVSSYYSCTLSLSLHPQPHICCQINISKSRTSRYPALIYMSANPLNNPNLIIHSDIHSEFEATELEIVFLFL